MASQDVEDIAIRVGSDPGQIAVIVITEFAHAHRLIFDHSGAALERGVRRADVGRPIRPSRNQGLVDTAAMTDVGSPA
jgi:hypothetical protein